MEHLARLYRCFDRRLWPAGLTLAAQLSKFPEIATCIVDQKNGPLELGQADGIACRTVEMFNAFGFAGTGAARSLLGE
jgi:2-polyprenyl-6-methoxyphenol hydroxylase-like FAD-dependent oxidoreductase